VRGGGGDIGGGGGGGGGGNGGSHPGRQPSLLRRVIDLHIGCGVTGGAGCVGVVGGTLCTISQVGVWVPG
jgi:hypothetical protein